MSNKNGFIAALIVGACCAPASAEEADHYVKKATWLDSMIATQQAIADSSEQAASLPPLTLFTARDYTFMARVKTHQGGTIVALSRPEGKWMPQGKSFFIDGRGVVMDIGFVGAVAARVNIQDGKWHHVALTQEAGQQKIYVDGKAAASGSLSAGPTPGDAVLMLGYTSTNFPHPNPFAGDMDEVRIFSTALNSTAIAAYAAGHVPQNAPPETVGWDFDGDGPQHAFKNEGCKLADGYAGDGIAFDQGARILLESDDSGRIVQTWLRLRKDFTDQTAQQEMAWEQEDGIWEGWIAGQYQALAGAYARAVESELKSKATELARDADDLAGALKVREVYLRDRKQRQVDALLVHYNIPAMRKMIAFLGRKFEGSYDAEKHLAAIEAISRDVLSGAVTADEVDARLQPIRREALLTGNPAIGFDKVIFIKRQTYNGNHYYTEFINGQHRGGGNICILDLGTGEVTDIVKGLPEDGVFRRFDLSYDGQRIVFAWKGTWEEGYRLYECNIDGTGLRQLTFPPDYEEELHEKYAIAGYHHGTDDMDPCYLPNGDIVFISTRCQYGILCDQPDIFTTTTLFRIDKDGNNMEMLSNSSVSEATPSVTPDGRILYTRWEYVDKGSSCVKCLWSMKPDGTASAEVYGNDIATPSTMIFGRAIPGATNKYVMIGSPHCCPWTALGTVIRLDTTKDIRTREPMEYMSPDVDVQGLGGEANLVYRKDGKWITNINGPIYREPYPLNEWLFLVAYKPEGPKWNDPKGYALSMLDEEGDVVEFYRDPKISCWQPMPLAARPTPPMPRAAINPMMAKMNKAMCVVTDVQHGMDGVEPGKVKYIRILEQRPRPWASRRYWGGDSGWGQQHVVTTRSTHLGLKVQHGVVPVEEDGSAAFYVPARSNIFFQALDENYRSIQTERTLVNYMPGENRSCVGCHETPNDAAARTMGFQLTMALRRAPSRPMPQPGDDEAGKIIDFRTMVQPVLNKHCVECHSGDKPKADLDLSDTQTDVFNVAYENLLNRGVCGRINNEVGPKTGNAEYQPPYTFGSYSSILAAMLSDGEIQLTDERANQRAKELAEEHKNLDLTLAEKIRIWNWIDTNCQFYGSYWGRRSKQYQGHANYRPISTFEEARSNECPIPEDKR